MSSIAVPGLLSHSIRISLGYSLGVLNIGK
jgi:hypothetical protein